MAEKKAHLTILILQLCVSFTNKLTTIINQLIKPLANIYHPFWKFLLCLIDEGIWHLLVIGIGHRACNGGKSVNIGAFPKIHRHIEMVDEGFCI